VVIIANFYGLLSYSYYFSAVDAVTDAAATTNTYMNFPKNY